jgi:hypothetical protein
MYPSPPETISMESFESGLVEVDGAVAKESPPWPNYIRKYLFINIKIG